MPRQGYFSSKPLRLASAILIVDDDDLIRANRVRAWQKSERLCDYRIFSAASVSEALEVLARETIQVMVLDKNLGPDPKNSHHNGIKALPEFLGLRPQLQVIMFTGSSAVDDVVGAMRAGAIGYITKDTHPDVVALQIEKAIEIGRLTSLKVQDEIDRGNREVDLSILGPARTSRELVRQLAALGESSRPVLLLGETGVGKTVIARAIHNLRTLQLGTADRPFVPVNLTSIPEKLLEAELFGAEEGAYTDAKRPRQGLIEHANNGTLFLDEIGEISLEVQVKLLTAIESGTFRRLGSNREIRSNFNLICATNKDLERQIELGLFREDLYMRIAPLKVRVPAVRDRIEDIPAIVRAVLPKVCKEAGVSVLFEDIPNDFLEALGEYPPRGNIRGIEAVLSNLLTFAPRDTFGRPYLGRWKAVNEVTAMFGVQARRDSSALSLEDLLNRPFNVLGDSFPGYSTLMEAVSERILVEAQEKFGSNRAIAKALKIAESTTSQYLKNMKMKAAWKGEERRPQGLHATYDSKKESA